MRMCEMPKKITVKTMWNADTIRQMCIKNGLYNIGNSRDYMEMLDYVREHPEPSEYDMYQVAVDICDRSSEQELENVMFLISRDGIRRFYNIEN